jgi:hypothetical protein
MNNEIPEEIVESINHFNTRAEGSIRVNALLDEIKKLKKLDFDDLKNVEIRAKSYIEVAEAQYRAGLVSEQEYIFHQYHAVVSLIHETRWLNGYYSDDLEPISQKMREIEKSYGLKPDEYWAKGDAPEEYQALEAEYEKVLESKLESEFFEFATDDVAKLFSIDRDHLEALKEIGRKSIFISDEVKRLYELAHIYEEESEINVKGKAFFSASIMLAAAIEARLIVHCINHRDEVRATLLKMGLSNKKLKSKNPLDWNLNTLIEVCGNAGWLPNFETERFVFNTMNIGHTLRNTRNLVHPGLHVKRKAALALGEEQFKDIKASYKLLSSILKWPNKAN